MTDEFIACPKCKECWPVLSEQRIAIEQFNECLKCSFFDHSAEEHVKLIEKIEEEMGLDFKAHIHALQNPGKAGITIAVAKDRANPYAESQVVHKKPDDRMLREPPEFPFTMPRREPPAHNGMVTPRRHLGLGGAAKRDRARAARKKAKKHRRKGR